MPVNRTAELTADPEPLIAAAEAHTASERAAATDDHTLKVADRGDPSDGSSNDHERAAALRGTPAADSCRRGERRHERHPWAHRTAPPAIGFQRMTGSARAGLVALPRNDAGEELKL